VPGGHPASLVEDAVAQRAFAMGCFSMPSRLQLQHHDIDDVLRQHHRKATPHAIALWQQPISGASQGRDCHGLPEKTASGSRSRLGLHGIARKPARPPQATPRGRKRSRYFVMPAQGNETNARGPTAEESSPETCSLRAICRSTKFWESGPKAELAIYDAATHRDDIYMRFHKHSPYAN
jgi:hypothetical protein